MSSSPYINAPLTPARPKMFKTKIAQIVWTLVPLVTLSIAAPVPMVVAAVKGVIKPWVAAVYVAAEIVVLGLSSAVGPDRAGNLSGLLIILVMVTAATHTALLDSEKVTIGK